MSYTFKNQRKLIVIEFKPLRPFLKIKLIEVHSKEVTSIKLIEIHVNWPPFKYKLEIKLEDFYLFTCNKYTEIMPLFSKINTN